MRRARRRWRERRLWSVRLTNDRSIADGCAKAFRALGADGAVTWSNENAPPQVAPLAEEVRASMLMPLDVRQPDQMSALFDAIRERRGRLDIMLHAVAYTTSARLKAGLPEGLVAGFRLAMDVFCHSSVRLARSVELLIAEGGAPLAMTFYGSDTVIEQYRIMGPVKAALAASANTVRPSWCPRAIG